MFLGHFCQEDEAKKEYVHCNQVTKRKAISKNIQPHNQLVLKHTHVAVVLVSDAFLAQRVSSSPDRHQNVSWFSVAQPP